MDGIIVAGFVLAVLALVLSLVGLGIFVYAFWRYSVQPWKVMRADVMALNQRFQELAATVQRANVIARSDEEVARIEARMSARERARRAGQS